MLNRLTIKQRLTALVCFIVTIGAIVGISAFIGFNNFQDATMDIAERRILLIRTANKALYTIADDRAQVLSAIESLRRGDQEQVAERLKALAENKSTLDAHFAVLDKNSKSEGGEG